MMYETIKQKNAWDVFLFTFLSLSLRIFASIVDTHGMKL